MTFAHCIIFASPLRSLPTFSLEFMFIIYALPSYRRLSASCNWLPVRLWGMKAFKSASQLQSTFNMQQSWQSSRAACPGDISDVSGWAAECRLCRHIVAMMFNVIVIMSLAGRQWGEGGAATVDCCSCVSFVWLQELGKWAPPSPTLVSSVGFQVSIFNTNLHPHFPAKDRSEPNNFGYYVKNHKKSPKFNALWPFFPAIYKYLFTVSQFFSFFLSLAALHI